MPDWSPLGNLGVRATWFHTGGPIRAGSGPSWYDPQGQREGAPASGLGHDIPGIATPGRSGLGNWYRVTSPDGQVAIVQKTDIGPGTEPRSRGVGADINAALAAQLYPGGPTTFKERGWKIEPLGASLPAGVTAGIGGGGWQETISADPAAAGGVSYARSSAGRPATGLPAEQGFAARFAAALPSSVLSGPLGLSMPASTYATSPALQPIQFAPLGELGLRR